VAHPLVSKTLLPKLPTSSNCENDCRIDENDDIDPLVSERVTLICAMARFPFLARFYFFHVHTSFGSAGCMDEGFSQVQSHDGEKDNRRSFSSHGLSRG